MLFGERASLSPPPGSMGCWVRHRSSALPTARSSMNVGHSHREIDVDWLDQHPRTTLQQHLDRYEVNGRRLYLLNRGSLVNLAADSGGGAPQLFDPFSAIMLLGLAAILQGRLTSLSAGVQQYPKELETRVARGAHRHIARLRSRGPCGAGFVVIDFSNSGHSVRR